MEINDRTRTIKDTIVPECWERGEDSDDEWRGYDIALLVLNKDIADPKRGKTWVELYDPTEEPVLHKGDTIVPNGYGWTGKWSYG